MKTNTAKELIIVSRRLGQIETQLDQLRRFLDKTDREKAEREMKFAGEYQPDEITTVNIRDIRAIFEWARPEDIDAIFEKAQEEYRKAKNPITLDEIAEGPTTAQAKIAIRNLTKKEEHEDQPVAADDVGTEPIECEENTTLSPEQKKQIKETAKKIAGVAKKRRSKVDHEAVIEMHTESGMSAKQIAEITGYNYNTVWKIIKEHKESE